MSFETIEIYRALPVINNYVQIPPNKETDKTRVTVEEALRDIAGSNIGRLSMGSGPQRGSRMGQQQWIILPPINPDTWYSIDPISQVAND